MNEFSPDGTMEACASSPRPQQPLTSAARSDGVPVRRILLAEDNRINQVVAIKVLERLGYQIDGVANGHEALHALAAVSYDLVLMDCQMPGMDGFTATRALRNGHAGELNIQVPVLAMTAFGLAGDRERCLDSGMNGYLAKPLCVTELKLALRQWIEDGVCRHGAAKLLLNSDAP